MRQHGSMNATDYFLPQVADEADISPWASILPDNARVLRTSLFGDAFLVDCTGAVHMLERGGCSLDQIAPSEEHFWRALERDEEGWQLRPLADACRSQGKVLAKGQCYAFKVLPVLGGDYVPDNVWVAPWQDWFSLTADIFGQMKELPDGASVTLKIID